MNSTSNALCDNICNFIIGRLTSVFARKIFQPHRGKKPQNAKRWTEKLREERSMGSENLGMTGINIDRLLDAQREKKKISIALFVLAGLTFYFFIWFLSIAGDITHSPRLRLMLKYARPQRACRYDRTQYFNLKKILITFVTTLSINVANVCKSATDPMYSR